MKKNGIVAHLGSGVALLGLGQGLQDLASELGLRLGQLRAAALGHELNSAVLDRQANRLESEK